MGKFIRSLVLSMFLCNVCWASPDTQISVPNSFTANTTIESAKTNANNNEISSKYNSNTHTDVTQVGTVTSGTWAATVVGTQYGGTGQNLASVASGGIIY